MKKSGTFESQKLLSSADIVIKLRTAAMTLIFTYLASLPAAAQFGFEVEPPKNPPAVEAPVDEPQGELTTYKGIQYFKPDGLKKRWIRAPDMTYTMIKGFRSEPEFKGLAVQIRVFPLKGKVTQETHFHYAKKSLRFFSQTGEKYVQPQNIDHLIGTNGTIRGMPGHVYENPYPLMGIIYSMYDEKNSRIVAVVGYSPYGRTAYDYASKLALDITASLSIPETKKATPRKVSRQKSESPVAEMEEKPANFAEDKPGAFAEDKPGTIVGNTVKDAGRVIGKGIGNSMKWLGEKLKKKDE